MIVQTQLEIRTTGRGLTNITAQVKNLLSPTRLQTGLCHVFLQHTSASLILSENADPDVNKDLEGFFSKLVIDGDPHFKHQTEGPDDMSAHIRSVLTQSFISIPVSSGHLALGTWQGIFLWEHRVAPHARKITVTFIGE